MIEAKLDKGRGPVATLLVENGTLRIGDAIVVGNTHGRVRAMVNDLNQRIEAAGPSTPIEITGLNVIIKGDVQGSVEALSGSLQKIDVEGVKINIIRASVGTITETDVTLAAASGAIIIGFNVRPSSTTRQQAANEGVDIRLHSIIYKVIVM